MKPRQSRNGAAGASGMRCYYPKCKAAACLRPDVLFWPIELADSMPNRQKVRASYQLAYCEACANKVQAKHVVPIASWPEVSAALFRQYKRMFAYTSMRLEWKPLTIAERISGTFQMAGRKAAEKVPAHRRRIGL